MRIVALVLFACTTPKPAVPPSRGSNVGLSGQWAASPCTRDGAATTIVGTLVVAPFGKGTDGARLAPDDGAPWVLTYRASPEMRELDGKRVSAHGWPCSKQGQAIVGRHFDADSLSQP